jgi:transposase
LEALALAVGGQAGSRLAYSLKMPCSADTLLRLVRRAPQPRIEPPLVIGVDDWAKRRGQVYGTIVVDLERRRTIDLLDDRQAQTLATWQQRQPQIEVMTRDRSGEYRLAAETALPQCQQVADRWHLLKNLRDTLERLVAHHRSAVRQPSPATAQPFSETAPSGTIPIMRMSDHLRYGAAARQERHQHCLTLFQQMQQAAAHGLTRAEIAHQLGVSSNTVAAYLARGGPPAEVCPRPQRVKKINPYLPHLTQRWQAGCRNASQLWREITELGFHGPRSLVARWVRERRETPAPTTAPRFRAAFQASSEPTASRTAASSE